MPGVIILVVNLVNGIAITLGWFDYIRAGIIGALIIGEGDIDLELKDVGNEFEKEGGIEIGIGEGINFLWFKFIGEIRLMGGAIIGFIGDWAIIGVGIWAFLTKKFLRSN